MQAGCKVIWAVDVRERDATTQGVNGRTDTTATALVDGDFGLGAGIATALGGSRRINIIPI